MTGQTRINRPGKGIMASVLGRMATSEVLISDRHADAMLLGLLGEAEKVEDAEQASDVARQDVAESWGFDDDQEDDRKPYVYQDGVAVIPVHGILINRFSRAWGFITGYEYIRRTMNLADADPDVELIVFDHDSPGGEAPGCEELAHEIGALKTPTMAVVNTLSCSASFKLAVPTKRLVCTPSGTVGSIGVYILHMNIRKALEEYGVELSYIEAPEGGYKTSGSPYKDMSKDDREYLQTIVNERYDEFVAVVAKYRGVEEGVARDTKARVLRPTEAISLGLIDAAMSPSKAVADFLAELGGGDPMNDFEQEDETIMADQEKETSAEDRAKERKAEQARIKGIMTSEEAKGREAQAEYLAYETELPVETAVGILATGPKAQDETPPEDDPEDEPTDETPPEGDPEGDPEDDKESEKGKGGSHFENAMSTTDNPDVGPNGKDGNESGNKIDQILAAQDAATGRRRTKAA